MITAINNYNSLSFQGRQDLSIKVLSKPALQSMRKILIGMAPEVTVSPNGLTFLGKYLTSIKGEFGQKFTQPVNASKGGTISSKFPPFKVKVDNLGTIINIEQPSLLGFKLMSQKQILKMAEKVLGYFDSNFNNLGKVKKNIFHVSGFTEKGWATINSH